MLCISRFKYYLQNKEKVINKNSSLWSKPLPMGRKKSQKAERTVTYGDYFCAARSFLEKNNFNIITSAIYQSLDQTIKPEEIQAIYVYLEKHGEFYHPAKVEIDTNVSSFLFVLNVAISTSGKNYIKREFTILNKLNNDFPFSFIPKAYSQGEIDIKDKNIKVSMFFGEWFDGYNEFHISLDKRSNFKIVVWDNEKGNFYLSADETFELYSQVTMILTCYYNAETFEKISSWHHAAGDFVIKLHNNNIKLKLITVRQYKSIFKNNNKITENKTNSDNYLMLETLLLFFLNLSIRNRLDRLDGVGEIVWSHDIAVYGTLKGFLKGLSKISSNNLNELNADNFINYISCFSKTDLLEICNSIVNTYSSNKERSIIKQNLNFHVDRLLNLIEQYC